jgi:hypothetical protein
LTPQGIYSLPLGDVNNNVIIGVAEILRRRYGSASNDLVPTDSSSDWLYGDHILNANHVEEARKRIFGEA